MSLSLSFAFVHPAGDILLARPRDGQRVLRHGLRDGRASRNVGAILYGDGGDEVRVAADESIVTDFGTQSPI